MLDRESVYHADTGGWSPLLGVDSIPVSSISLGGKVRPGQVSIKDIDSIPMVRVTTAFGRKITLSPKDCLLSDRDKSRTKSVFMPTWVEVETLDVGDKIALATTVTEPTEPTNMPTDHVELLAVLLSGEVLQESVPLSLFLRPEDVRLQARVIELVESLGNSTASLTGRTMRGGRVEIAVACVNPGESFGYLEFLRKYDTYSISDHTAKRIPSEVFKLPLELVQLFVSRMFDAGGWVSVGSAISEMGLNSYSRGFVQDVSNLWLRLGALAYVREHGKTFYVKVSSLGIGNGLYNLATKVNLLDRQEAVDSLLDESHVKRKFSKEFGDVYWDKVTKIESVSESPCVSVEAQGFNNIIVSGGVVCRTENRS